MQPQKERILCVDDDADTCEAITILLGYKYETKGIKDAHEAMEVAQQEAFDLYIIDTWLPGHPDNELCRKLRTSAPQTPIIVYSAAVYHADRKAAFEAGATTFVAKPYVDKLLEAVSQFLG
ncbi:MAG: response regulator [Pyrinomonadaceae bacterium]